MADTQESLTTPIVKTDEESLAQNRKYFNESSPNIYHSNPNLGSGIVGGSVAGIENDEEGKVSINPTNFLLGLIGGSVGSKTIAQGFKALKENPALRDRVTKELASSLSKGWESAIRQYPLLQSLEPRYIVKNEKGREIQAKAVLKEVEKADGYTKLPPKAMVDRLNVKNAIIPRLSKGEKLPKQDIIKALESSSQKGGNMLVIGKDNFNKDILQWSIKNNKKIAIDTLDEKQAKEYGFKYPNVKRTIGASEINHTLLRHGENSLLVKNSGQKAVHLDDIANYLEYTDKADIKTTTKDRRGQEVLISGKQINGYYVIVEHIRKKHNELAFKTMYFENGKLENHKDFKKLRDN